MHSSKKTLEIEHLNVKKRSAQIDRSNNQSPMSTYAGSSNIGGSYFLYLICDYFLENYAIRKSIGTCKLA